MNKRKVLKTYPVKLGYFEESKLRQILLEEGVLRINHPEITQADFLTLGDLLGHNFVSEGTNKEQYRSVGASGRRKVLHSSQSVFSAPGKFFALPLHGECYFEQRYPPHLLWFFCEAGEGDYQSTTVCDGIKLFEQLNTQDQELFLNNPLCYERYHTESFWKQQYLVNTPEELTDYLKSQDRELIWLKDHCIKTRFIASAIHLRNQIPAFVNSFLPFALRQLHRPEETRARVSFANGQPLKPELILRVAEIAESLTYHVDWHKGDILVIDNTRMMHGRESISTQDPRALQVRLSSCKALLSVS